jgi:2-oxoglutarate ferredoxin oxidoreductase subunit beta
VFEEAARFKGTSVVEVLQNCVIFNDGIHEAISDPKMRDERQIFLKHGEPMIFGNNRDKGIILDKGNLRAVQIGENGVKPEDILVHDASEKNGFLHHQLINMKLPDFPVAMGVIRAVPSKVYNEAMEEQIAEAKSKSRITSVDQLLSSGNTWKVE